MAQKKLTKEQKAQKRLANMSLFAGVSAFIAAYSGALLKRRWISKIFTFLAGASVFMVALLTKEEGVEAPATDVDD